MLWLVAAWASLAPAPGPAAETLGGLAPGGRGVVREIVDGDTLILALALGASGAGQSGEAAAGEAVAGGEVAGEEAAGDEAPGHAMAGEGPAGKMVQKMVQVRLVDIQAPKLPLGRRGFRKWPLADAAKAALARLTLGRALTLSYGGRRIDRHGRRLAHLHDGAGRWIQGEMLALGLARVYSFADNRRLVPEMLALERAARAARRGIWAHPYYRVLEAGEAGDRIGSFQLVEGRVRAAAVVRGRGYLNFGDDWRSDFTVSVSAKARRLFAAEGLDLAALEGRRVRVRGWLKSWNGPMIEATHPEQIEVLEE